ncbi:MAG: hypothetical protein M1281_00470 [Chloroflexi bacterium]|nr:hypothetical protein [Chloroflexota bacterium]
MTASLDEVILQRARRLELVCLGCVVHGGFEARDALAKAGWRPRSDEARVAWSKIRYFRESEFTGCLVDNFTSREICRWSNSFLYDCPTAVSRNGSTYVIAWTMVELRRLRSLWTNYRHFLEVQWMTPLSPLSF